MIIKPVATAAALGVAATFALAAPASAATAPRLNAPTVRTGFGTITLSGTADPGATVQLYETAQIFDDMAAADDWEHGGGPVTVTAGANGRFEIRRWQDSGFYFEVVAGGLRSNRIKVDIKVQPTLTISASGSGAVEATVAADPAQPGLSVQLQRASGSSWVTVGSGQTDANARFTTAESGLYGGTYTYRAHIATDAKNGVLANYSSSHRVTVDGPANPNPTPTPTNPTPTPTAPAAGSVQFTRIQYNAPGTDKKTNASVNGEWFRLTNKTKKSMSLKGWTVRDAAGATYTFGTYTLGAGKSVTVRTGKGTSSSTYRYWGRTNHVWNNGGDTATLRTNLRKTIDTCKWGKGSGATNC